MSSTFSMSDHISSVSKSCFSFIHDLRRILNTLDYSLHHYAHYRHISHTLKTQLLQFAFSEPSPISALNRLLLIRNSSALAVSKILPHHSSSSLSIGSKFNSVSKSNLSPIKLYSLHSLLVSTAFPMFNITVQLATLTSLF